MDNGGKILGIPQFCFVEIIKKFALLYYEKILFAAIVFSTQFTLAFQNNYGIICFFEQQV